MTRDNARTISADMMEALKAVALKHGIQFSQKSGSFSGTHATFKIEAAVVTANGVAETAERTSYIAFCHQYGLHKEWLDKTFIHGTDTFTIIGLNTRKSKNPVMCKSSHNGKTYIFPPLTVKALMLVQNSPQ